MKYLDPLKVIQKYYRDDSEVYHFLVEHSKAVAKKAVEICDKAFPSFF